MATNDLINVYDPTLWATMSLMQLFPMLKMSGMMYREFENTVASQGDTVNTRLPNKFIATDVDPDNFASNKPKADNVQIKMDQWKQVVFEIGDKEASLGIKDLTQEFFTPAAFAMAQVIEQTCLNLYKDTYTNIGTAGTTPATVAALGTDIQQQFSTMQIPEGTLNRKVLFGPAAANKFNQVFYSANVSGSAEQQQSGSLIPKFGNDNYDSNQMPKHVRGTGWASGAVQISNTGALTANDVSILKGQLPQTSTVALKGLSANGTVNKGDLLTIDHTGSNDTDGNALGVSQYTVVTGGQADGTGALSNVVLSPGLRAAVTNSQAVTGIASHDVNLAFHPMAFALASRPMIVPTAPGASVAVQNLNGIGIRSSVWYEPKDIRTYVRLDLLFGVKTLDPRKAFRVLG